jgi:glycosyltransferase involved in cell wall biosynthesis
MPSLRHRSVDPSVSVIVAAFNQESLLPQLLAGLERQTWSGRLQVVVADNNSTDLTVRNARDFADRIADLQVFTAARAQGQCAARNDALERATGDLLLFIDGDDVPADDWVAEMVIAAQGGDLVGGRLDVTKLNRASTVERWPGATESCLASLPSFPLPYATGTNFAVWRYVLDDVGGWNEVYRGGGEDAELCWRAQIKGYSLVAAERAIVHYRLRHRLRDLVPQNYRYGLAVARLQHDFPATSDAAGRKRDLASIATKAPRALLLATRSADKRARLMAVLAFRYGRLRGSRHTNPVSASSVRRAVRSLAGPYRAWTIEVAMRYLPVVRLAERFGDVGDLTEVGSGGTGIAPYLGRPVVGVDQDFGEESSPLMTQIRSSVLALPFADASRRHVVSVDMLEHVPPQLRGQALEELVRVTGDLLIVAVPSGAGAASQDAFVDELYRQRHGENYPFLSEHVTYGLPSRSQLDVALRQAMTRHGRTGDVSYFWNTNLRVRKLLMRVWVDDRLLARAFLVFANYLHPVITRLHLGRCYRLIAVVRMDAYESASSQQAA